MDDIGITAQTGNDVRRLKVIGSTATVTQMHCARTTKYCAVTADNLWDDEIGLAEIAAQKNLQALRIKFRYMGRLAQGFWQLQACTHLKQLSLYNINNLGGHLADLHHFCQLERLELGPCENVCVMLVSTVLPSLKQLKHLRLECFMSARLSATIITNVARNLPLLTRLELINFEIHSEFCESMAHVRFQKFLIAPNNYGHIFDTLDPIYCAIFNARKTLTHVTWVINCSLREAMLEWVPWKEKNYVHHEAHQNLAAVEYRSSETLQRALNERFPTIAINLVEVKPDAAKEVQLIAVKK